MKNLTLLFLFCLSFFGTAQTVTEPKNNPAEWSKDYQPFKIVGNLYYVGTYDLASYLIVTDKGNILIAVTADGQVWLDKQVVDVRSVRAHVERMRQEQPEGVVVVQADQDARTGLVVQVMDQARLAGVDDVVLAASTESR